MDLEAVKRLATCDYCYTYLDSPVILPCSRIICESHLKEPNFQNKFYCSGCKDFHQNSSDGFKKMDKINDILLAKSHLSEEEKDLNKSIDEIILESEFFLSKLKTSKIKSELLVHDELVSLRTGHWCRNNEGEIGWDA